MLGVVGVVVLLVVAICAMIKNRCKMESFMMLYMLVVFLGAGFHLGLK